LKNRSENPAGGGRVLPVLQVNNCSIDQKSGEICAGEADLPPTFFILIMHCQKGQCI
jgi:hypothetical protein